MPVSGAARTHPYAVWDTGHLRHRTCDVLNLTDPCAGQATGGWIHRADRLPDRSLRASRGLFPPGADLLAGVGVVVGFYGFLMMTWISPMRTVPELVASIGMTPDSPMPFHSTCHSDVAVIVYSPCF